MGNKKLKKRSEIDQKYKWKIEAMYADDQAWQADIDQVLSMAEEFSAYQGRLTESAAALSAAFQEKDALWQKLEKAYVYARMKLDEDNREAKQQSMHDKVNAVIAKVSAAMSFFTPELLSAPEELLRQYMDSEASLEQYRFVIEDLLRE